MRNLTSHEGGAQTIVMACVTKTAATSRRRGSRSETYLALFISGIPRAAMSTPFRRWGPVERGTANVPVLALAFGGHLAVGALALMWARGAESRPPAHRPPVHEPAAERVLFVEAASERAPRPAAKSASGRASTQKPSAPTRPAAVGAHAIASAVVPMASAPVMRDSAKTADVEGQGNRTDIPAAIHGIYPRLSDRRLWSPAEPGRPSQRPSLPQSVIDEALAPVVDSIMQERRSAGRAASDWTVTDQRGRSWGLAPSGLRLGRVGLSIQPPELTDRERAQLAARADIARFRHMTPGDAGFDSLRAALRQQQEQRKRPGAPPV